MEFTRRHDFENPDLKNYGIMVNGKGVNLMAYQKATNSDHLDWGYLIRKGFSPDESIIGGVELVDRQTKERSTLDLESFKDAVFHSKIDCPKTTVSFTYKDGLDAETMQSGLQGTVESFARASNNLDFKMGRDSEFFVSIMGQEATWSAQQEEINGSEVIDRLGLQLPVEENFNMLNLMGNYNINNSVDQGPELEA